MSKEIIVKGYLNWLGAISLEACTVFFNKHIKNCSCGGSYSYSAMLEVEQIKQGDFVDTCATIECNDCYSMLDVEDFNITLEIPDNLNEQFAKGKIWARSKDFAEMSQGVNSFDWDIKNKGKSFKELAEDDLKRNGII